MIIDFTASIVTGSGIRSRVEAARMEYGADCGAYFDYLLGKGEKTFCESACGFLLLDSLLIKHGIDRGGLAIFTDENGRPRISREDVDFSVSHNGGCAMCAVALGENARVGCDIQRERKYSDEKLIALGRTFMTDEELRGLLGTERKAVHFHSAWVKREAYAKSVGADILDCLKSIDIRGEKFREGIINAVGNRYYYAVCGSDNYSPNQVYGN